MKKKLFKAFTLIEFMVAISIFFILATASYAPYNYYSKKAKIRLTGKEISQVLNEARNMAINGITSSASNVSIGVYLDKSDANKNKLQILSYPYNINNSNISTTVLGDIKLLKSYNLQKGIEIDRVEGKDTFLFFFKSITGDINYLTNDTDNIFTNTGEIDIHFSYKDSISPNLQGTVTYYTDTNTVDY